MARTCEDPLLMESLRKWKYDVRLATHSPVIALPERLIAILQDQLPDGILSKEDFSFERALRRAGTGCFLGRPFRSDVAELRLRLPGQRTELAKSTRRSRPPGQAKIEPRMRQLLEMMGVKEALHDGEREDEWIPARVLTDEHDAELRRGYCGWLLTHPQFNVERFRLPLQVRNAEDRQRLKTFCMKWFLRDIVARLIPEPFAFSKSVTTKQTPGPQGLSLSVPWPHLRSSAFGLRSLVSEDEKKSVSHIAGWLDKKGTGPDTYSKIFDLCLYRDYGLYQRYRARRFDECQRVLHLAFAEYWGLAPSFEKERRRGLRLIGNDTARKLSKDLRTAYDQTAAIWASTAAKGREAKTTTSESTSDQITAKSEQSKSRNKSAGVGRRRNQRLN